VINSWITESEISWKRALLVGVEVKGMPSIPTLEEVKKGRPRNVKRNPVAVRMLDLSGRATEKKVEGDRVSRKRRKNTRETKAGDKGSSGTEFFGAADERNPLERGREGRTVILRVTANAGGKSGQYLVEYERTILDSSLIVRREAESQVRWMLETRPFAIGQGKVGGGIRKEFGRLIFDYLRWPRSTKNKGGSKKTSSFPGFREKED